MTSTTKKLATQAQQLSEQHFHRAHQQLYSTQVQLLQLEDRYAAYQAHSTTQSWRLKLQQSLRRWRWQRRLWRWLHKVPFLKPRPKKPTVVVIDKGHLHHTIHQLQAHYRVEVWRLEGSTQDLPRGVKIRHVPGLAFHYAIGHELLLSLVQMQQRPVCIVVDGFIEYVPFLWAAHQHIPTVVCFEQALTTAPVMSSWRLQQHFFWSQQLIIAPDDANTTALPAYAHQLLQQAELLSSPSAASCFLLQSLAQRSGDWWPRHIHVWQQQQSRQQQQIEYLSQQHFDATYYEGHEEWRRLLSTPQRMQFFLLAWRLQLFVRQLLPGFDMHRYAAAHPHPNGLNPLVDYLQKDQPSGPWQRSLIVAEHGPAPQAHSVALHIHAYYIDSLATIKQRLEANQLRPDVYISVRSAADQQLAHDLWADYPAKVVLRIVPNRGRDIGPFLTEFGAELVHNYSIIGHVHTKQSIYHPKADLMSAWQQFLFTNVLGDAQRPMMDSIVRRLQKQPDLGLVYPDDPNVMDWGPNKEYAQLIMQAMNLDPALLPTGGFKFPIGTMFWLRADVLKPLVDLQWQWEDYPTEPLSQDGSILHAIERLFAVLPEAVGLDTALSYNPGVSR